MPDFLLHPDFLTAPSGNLFVMGVTPTAESTGQVVLFIPPFAEEMNKSRKMLSLTMQRLARRGVKSQLIDLYGTGDSEGELHQASWRGWLDDLVHWFNQVAEQPEVTNIHVVAMRTGALLLADLLHMEGVCAAKAKLTSVQYWQPVFNGTLFINQFLRLRLAADMMSDGGEKLTTKDLLGKIKQGEAVEVAGYQLVNAVVEGMLNAQGTALPEGLDANITVFDINASGKVSPAMQRAASQLQELGLQTQLDALAGPAFWSTQEIALCPELVNASCQVITPAQEVIHG